MTVPESRRARASVAARRARRRRILRRRRWVAGVLAVGLLIGGATALTSAMTGPVTDEAADRGRADSDAPPAPAPATPAADEDAAAPNPCDDPDVTAALAAGTDAEVIAAFGGAVAFRDAVAEDVAACIDLSAADRIWVVVNKRHPLDPLDYWPVPQARAEGVQRTSGGHMRADVAAAVSELAGAAVAEGAGAIGVNSGFRSYDFQTSTYRGYVSSLGQAAADARSARPGHSEHQTGLAVDVVACANGCGGIEAFGGTAQAEWVAANAWRFGFVVRYESGQTDITGYTAEPWHLRYIGTDLAAAYRDGGFRTLEEFFGVEPAPDYGG